jgi:hypothetical protein
VTTWPLRKRAGFLADYYCPGCHAQQRGLPHGIHCNGTASTKPKRATPADVIIDDCELELGETFGGALDC